MRPAVSSLSALFLLFLAIPALALDGPTREALGYRFAPPSYSLDDDGRMSERQFARLLTVMRDDQGTNALLLDVTAKMGFTRPEQLIDLVVLCAERRSITIGGPQEPLARNETARGNQGHMAASYRVWSQALRPDGHYAWGEDAEAELEGSAGHREVDTATQRKLYIMNVPTICINRESSLFDAFITLTHEMTHLQGALNDLRDSAAPGSTDVLAYRDAADYAEKHLDEPGGEMDAFIAETRAGLTLEHTARANWEGSMTRHFFSDDGTLTDRPGLKRRLLDDFGYRERFVAEYGDHLAANLSEATADLERVSARLARRPDDAVLISENARLQARVASLRARASKSHF